MQILKIIILSISSISILFILTKIIGCREMSQLSMFDYINSITIGSIAAEMATSLDDNFIEPLMAMIVYSIIILFLAFISSKSVKLREIINGKSLILLNNGKLYKENFKKSKLDLNEFLLECRVMGYFNLSEISTAILEPNGKISIIPNINNKQVTVGDLNLNIEQEKLTSSVIIDGKIIKENLKATGNNMVWLENKLKEQHFKDVKDIFLATCDKNNNLSIYVKYNSDLIDNFM